MSLLFLLLYSLVVIIMYIDSIKIMDLLSGGISDLLCATIFTQVHLSLSHIDDKN